MISRHKPLCFCRFLLACFIASTVATSAQADSNSPGFHSREYVDADKTTHRYVIFVPYKIAEGTRPPALLFLHGSGERGSNGLDQIMIGLGPAIWKQKGAFPFVTVLPQCRGGGNWRADGADATRALEMLKLAQQEFDTDPDRVYLTGLSMGGAGAWSIAAKHPKMFAAVVPMCSAVELEIAPKLAAAKLPIWDFCGDADHAGTVSFSRKMHEALTKAGANAHYTEYPGVGHNCWDNAYGTPELFTWLLEQSRSKNDK